MTENDAQVTHDVAEPSGGRFALWLSGKEHGELTYRRQGSLLLADHTFVDPPARGGGNALQLVLALVAFARAEKLHIVPNCSYVRALFQKRNDFSDVAAKSP